MGVYEQTFANEIKGITDSLTSFLNTLPESLNPHEINDIRDKLKWASDYFSILTNPHLLHSQQLPSLIRGNVVLVKHGENLGMEISGDHPAIVLRNNSTALDQVLILPLTSKKPKAYRDGEDSIYLEFGVIDGLKGFQDPTNPDNPDNGKHWANVLNIRNISRSRIYIPPIPATADGTFLNKISGAICTQIALRKNVAKSPTSR